ncbi:hypothetical protein T439DRAFT_226327 [Meredithblackwellia eburnea MCA 4105]
MAFPSESSSPLHLETTTTLSPNLQPSTGAPNLVKNQPRSSFLSFLLLVPLLPTTPKPPTLLSLTITQTPSQRLLRLIHGASLSLTPLASVSPKTLFHQQQKKTPRTTMGKERAGKKKKERDRKKKGAKAEKKSRKREQRDPCVKEEAFLKGGVPTRSEERERETTKPRQEKGGESERQRTQSSPNQPQNPS